MPGRALSRKLAAVIVQQELDRQAAKDRWDAVPQERKDRLEKFLKAHRDHPYGLVYK